MVHIQSKGHGMFLTLNQEHCDALQQQSLYTVEFCIFGTGVRLFSDNAFYIEKFKKIYEHFIPTRLATGYITCYLLDRCDFTPGSCIIIDTALYDIPSGPDFLECAEILLFQKLFKRIGNYLLIHAGVVEKDDRGYVIYAPSGIGKTTLVLKLVSMGYRFLSDEYCPLMMDELRIAPFRRRLGVKRGNPFLNDILSRPDTYVNFGNKYYVDCDRLFYRSAGTACAAKYFIMLTGGHEKLASQPAMRKLTVALFNDTQPVIDIFCRLEGVSLLERIPKGFYTEYIFSLPCTSKATSKVHQIMQQYEKEFYFVAPVNETKTDFTNTPDLVPMRKSEAVFEILTNLINRSPSSNLLSQHADKNYNLLLKIGAFINDVACYQLTTGNLNEMANIINSL